MPTKGENSICWAMAGSPHEPRRRPILRRPALGACRGCRRFLRFDGKRAVVAGGRSGCGVEGRTAFGGRRAGRRLCGRSRTTTCGRSRQRRRPAPSRCIARRWTPADFAGAAIAVAECADRRRSRAIRRRRARRRRAGQCHRPAGLLRFCLRRHRQPLAAGHRHLDRRRRAGVRPGDPRQDRSPDPERLCALGGSRPHMAPARAGAGAVVPRPAQFLGEVRRPRCRRARHGADRGRFRRVA